ncbi:MAG: transposase, partial [Bacilli bacterium]|nr:transposase [Bacilli bacterium]
SDEEIIGLYDVEKEEERVRQTQLLGAERKGIEKGQKEKTVEITKNMLKDRMDILLIKKYTNLSESEIESLK